MGPGEGPKQTFYWSPWWNVQACAVRGAAWFVLALLMILRPNRCWRAWLAVIPAIIISLPVQFTDLVDLCLAMFANSLAFVPLSVALIWLAAPWMTGRRWGVAMAMAVVLAVLPDLTYLAAHYDDYLVLPNTAVMAGLCAAGYLAGATVFVCSMASAATLCRRRYTPTRFRFYLLGVLMFVSSLLTVVSVALLEYYFDHKTELPLVAIFPGAGLGLVVWLLSYYHLLLIERSPLYRERFRQLFGLEPAVEEPRGELTAVPTK